MDTSVNTTGLTVLVEPENADLEYECIHPCARTATSING
jgi:hypothetical protein